MEAEEGKSYPLDDVFDYMYSDKPAELVRQKEEYEEFLKWKEVQR
jgi:pyruvate dehydrogenase E1 component alpha subunit